MTTFTSTTNSGYQTTNDAAGVIAALKSDRWFRADDLEAGKRVAALLVGVVSTGLLMITLTVLLTLK